jgi:hypothetical protein
MKANPLPLLVTTLCLFTPWTAFSQEAHPADGPVHLQEAGYAAAGEAPLPLEGLIRMEVFSLPLEAGRAATRKFPKQADLYAWLGAELEKENPTVKLERLMVLRVRGGQKSKLEEIDEYPFPTEFAPAQVPQSIGIGQPAPATTNVTVTPPTPPSAPPAPASPDAPPAPPSGAKGDAGPTGAPAAVQPPPAGASPLGSVFSPWLYTPATPHTFQFKKTGWTTEIEMTIADDEETVDLNILPEFTRLCGLESQSPGGEVVQPIFENSKIATQILTKMGQPTLAGTFSPPADAGAPGGNLEKVTRLLFLTVTNPR